MDGTNDNVHDLSFAGTFETEKKYEPLLMKA